MSKSITYIAPHKSALTVALVFSIISLLFVVPMIIMFSFMPATDQDGNPIDSNFPFYIMIFLPVMYFVMGYLFTGFASFIYNKVAKFTGGITYESIE